MTEILYDFQNNLTGILPGIGAFVSGILGLIFGASLNGISGAFLGVISGTFLGYIVGCISGTYMAKIKREKMEQKREEYIKNICKGGLILDTCSFMNLGCFCEKCYSDNAISACRENMFWDDSQLDDVNMSSFYKNDNRILNLCKTAHCILLLEKVLREKSIKIILHRHVYQELQKIYNFHDKQRSPKAQRAKHLIERWQKLNLIHSFPDIEDKEVDYYADDALLEYIEQLAKDGKNVAVMTFDLDLRIRIRDRINSNNVQVLSFEDICNGSGYLESSDNRKQDVFNDLFSLLDNSSKTVKDNKKESGTSSQNDEDNEDNDEDSEDNNNTDAFATVQRPRERLADIAGMEHVKEQFYEMVIMPLREPELYKKYGIQAGGGILLYGPPGTGKTYIVKALAGELGAAFYAVKSSDILSPWVGKSEKNLKKLFAEARKNKLSVIFMDEIDSLAQDRSKNIRTHETQLINALLEELDGFAAKDSKNYLLFIGATNRPDTIDGALLRPGRFDVKIKVGLPDFAARRKILELFFSKRKIAISQEILDYIAQNTENYNCADVDNIAEKIIKTLLKEEISAKINRRSVKAVITAEMINKVLSTTTSSVLQRDLTAIEKWEQSQGI